MSPLQGEVERRIGDDTVINFLKSLEEKEKKSNPPGRNMDTIWKEYLRKMSKPGEWATELIIMATAIYFGKNIKVIKEDYVWIWEGGANSEDPPMVIVNMNESHFQSVLRKHI